jgi:MFS family permease
MSTSHDPYAALRLPQYRRFLVGNMLAGIGTEMLGVAVGWELYQRTNSATALGLVGLAQFLPFLLLALPSGHAADRYNRKLIFAGAQLLGTCAALSLCLLSFWEGPVSLIYLCLAGTGASQALRMPARSALVPQLVPLESLANAIAWNSSGWQIASVAGPALGGAAIALTGRAMAAYLVAGACLAMCASLIFTIRPRAAALPREDVTLTSLLAGVRFVFKTKLILATITLDLFAVLLGGATALLPIFARDILGTGPTGLGWLRAAPSLGAIVMALALAHRPPLRRAGRALLWSVSGFGAATVVFGLSKNFPLSFIMLALTGALDNVSMVVRGTLLQLLTPDEMRGRVSAVNSIFIGSSNELGAFESGITAQLFGPVLSVVGGGIGTILVVIAVVLRWPEVLGIGSLGSIQPAVASPEEPRPAAVETSPVEVSGEISGSRGPQLKN